MADFYWLYTALGLAKRAAAEAGGDLVAPATFLVGDGNGAYHTPEEIVANGGLFHQVWTGPVNRVYQHPVQNNLVVIEAIIPPAAGGWTIREAGIKDAAGDLIIVGKYPATEKPAPGSGGEKQIIVRGGMRISNGGDTVVQIDSSMVMATQEYVDGLLPGTQLTLTDANAPTGDTGIIATLLGFLANRIKGITGKSSWRAAPATTLEAANTHHGRVDNPHATTAAQVGASPTGHNHAGTYEPANANIQQHIAAPTPHAGHAPLASPGLTGTPTAPTPAQGTNNTQLATTAYVVAALAALINSAPGLLDTLDELAAALGDDPNFATTIANQLALKAPLASPGLTGTPTAPTPAQGTNNTQLATAAFVVAALLGKLGVNETAYDSTRLGAQLASFYRDASNLNAGTVAVARLPAAVKSPPEWELYRLLVQNTYSAAYTGANNTDSWVYYYTNVPLSGQTKDFILSAYVNLAIDNGTHMSRSGRATIHLSLSRYRANGGAYMQTNGAAFGYHSGESSINLGGTGGNHAVEMVTYNLGQIIIRAVNVDGATIKLQIKARLYGVGTASSYATGRFLLTNVTDGTFTPVTVYGDSAW